MMSGRWFLGAVAGGLALGVVGAQAAPMPVVTAEAQPAAQPVQFYYYYDNPPPVFYDPPPRRYYYDALPASYYYGPPRERYWRRPPPPPIQYRPRPHGGSWDREDAKEYRKAQRRYQKDIDRERGRGWSRTNGY